MSENIENSNVNVKEETFSYPSKTIRTELFVPDYLSTWKTDEVLSEEYLSMKNEILAFTAYMGKKIDESQELINSFPKKCELFKTFITEVVDNVIIPIYTKVGILNSVAFKLNYDIEKAVELAIFQRSLAQEIVDNKNKVDEYVE